MKFWKNKSLFIFDNTTKIDISTKYSLKMNRISNIFGFF